MLIFPGLRLFLFFVFFALFFLHCEQFINKSRWLCATAVLSFPTAATSTTTGWQAHYLSLSAEYCLTNETQIKLYKLLQTSESPSGTATIQSHLAAFPPTDSFTTHLLHIQFAKALSVTYVCAFVLKLPLFDFISLRHLVCRQSLWTWIYIFLWFPNWAFLPVCSICLPHPTTNGLLPVGRLPVCCRDWPKLPAALWPWCQGWSRGWGGRPAPDWSHRYLVKEASCDISAALTKCKVMISILSWYQVEGRRCSWYRHRFHVKSL